MAPNTEIKDVALVLIIGAGIVPRSRDMEHP